MITKEDVLEVLKTVYDPEIFQSIVALNTPAAIANIINDLCLLRYSMPFTVGTSPVVAPTGCEKSVIFRARRTIAKN